MLFTENGANSSLEAYQAVGNPPESSTSGLGSRWRHNRRLRPPYRGINHACGTFWRDRALANSLAFAHIPPSAGLFRRVPALGPDPKLARIRASYWSGAFFPRAAALRR